VCKYLEKAYFLTVQLEPVWVAEPDPEIFNILVYALNTHKMVKDVC